MGGSDYQAGADESPLLFLQEIEEVEVIHLLQSWGYDELSKIPSTELVKSIGSSRANQSDGL